MVADLLDQPLLQRHHHVIDILDPYQLIERRAAGNFWRPRRFGRTVAPTAPAEADSRTKGE